LAPREPSGDGRPVRQPRRAGRLGLAPARFDLAILRLPAASCSAAVGAAPRCGPLALAALGQQAFRSPLAHDAEVDLAAIRSTG